jgi:hypothetical protein
MHDIWTLYNYVSKDRRIRGYWTKPERVREHIIAGNIGVQGFDRKTGSDNTTGET